MKRKLLKISISDWVGIIAVIIAIISLAKTCVNDSAISELSYNDKGLEYRPSIVIADTPVVERIRFKNQIPTNLIGPLSDTGLLESQISVDFKIKLKNTSNVKAVVVGYLILDTVNGGSILREIIMNKKEFFKKCKIGYDSNFYELMEIFPNEIKTIKIPIDLMFPKNNQVVIHFICYYFNEFNVLFDSYYWLRFNIKEFVMKYDGTDSSGKVLYSAANKDIQNFLKFYDLNLSSKMYNFSENKIFRENWNQFNNKK